MVMNSNSTSKIGIFGGSFNPIHNAHIEMACVAYDTFKLDKLIFVPNNNPNYKDTTDEVANSLDRFNMIVEAIKSVDSEYNFEVSDIEIKENDFSYTYETLKKFKDIYPNSKIYFIMGQDSLDNFYKWKNPDKVSKLAELIVFIRSDKKAKKKVLFTEKIYNEMYSQFGTKVNIINWKGMDISSRQIREDIRNKKQITDLQDGVLKYIREKNLYNE